MQAQYGNYFFPANAVIVGMRQVAELNAAQVPYLINREIDLEGRLYGTGQLALATQESLLVQAVSTPFQNFIFRMDSGGATTATSLINNLSISGVTCIRGPDFTSRYGAEYVNQREFRLTFHAKFAVTNPATVLLEFEEHLRFSGGGPEYVEKPAINGPPDIQLGWFQRAYRLTQAGRAVGFLGYPTAPGSLFPANLMTSPILTSDSPQRIGNRYNRFPIGWTYEMISSSPMIAVPNIWR
jgi:hypothetical protein